MKLEINCIVQDKNKRNYKVTEIRGKQVVILAIVLFSLFVFSACSDQKHEGFIGTGELQVKMGGFETISEESVNEVFDMHENILERSFYQSGDTIIMFEQIDNLEGKTRTYMCIDSLIDAPKTHERYAFVLGSARGRIVDNTEEMEENHCYVSILDEPKCRAFYIECYSDDSDITESLKKGFETVYYFGNEYSCDIENVADKYPEALSVNEARKHDGEIVTVKGEKYSYGWTAVGIGGSNTMLQIDGSYDEDGLGVHMTIGEDDQTIPQDCLGFLEGTVYVRGRVVVNNPVALIWLQEGDYILCDYETYIFHDLMMNENEEYNQTVERYIERGYEIE